MADTTNINELVHGLYEKQVIYMPGTSLHDHHSCLFLIVFTLLRNLVIFNDILMIFPEYYLNKYPIKSHSIPNCLGTSPIESY